MIHLTDAEALILFRMRAQGSTWPEIAERLGYSVDVVRREAREWGMDTSVPARVAYVEMVRPTKTKPSRMRSGPKPPYTIAALAEARRSGMTWRRYSETILPIV